MERVRFTREMEATIHRTSSGTGTTDRRGEHPVLVGSRVTVRALHASDAASLAVHLTAPEVARFIAAPPATVEGFERFIRRKSLQGTDAKTVWFAITLNGTDSAIGIIQIRELEPRFQVAEWGFALASAFWGTGVFMEAASLVLEFAFEQLGVHRLEARAAVRNGRGGRALQKVGAVQEGVLRKAFLKDGRYLDQVMYSIVAEDWRASRETRRMAEPSVIH